MRPMNLLLIIFSCLHVELSAEPIRHHLSVDPQQGHLIAIESRFPGQEPPLELMMAVWTPGSYLVREFSRHLEGLEAFDSNGRPLAVTKPSKNHWRVASTSGPVTVRYRVYAREMTVRTSFVDSELALLNATSLFLVPQDRLKDAHEVTLSLPAGWRAFSALSKRDQTLVARDFDELVDSPIVAGQARVSSFEAGGVGHHLVHLGDTRTWDLDQAAEDVATLVSRNYLFWGNFPYRDPYYFFNLVTDARGGLEHQRSTVMMTNRYASLRREDYLEWLGLVSHEYFHVWNVKHLRPESLVEYDYESENYTPSLWFSEGLTSYYGPVMLSRAGLMTPIEYFKALAKRIRDLELKPGQRVRSLEQSSLDAWIKHYRPDENSINSAVSYYNKGAVVGFLLDAEIRRLSDGENSLDDLMREARKRFAGRNGFRPEDIRMLASSLAGEDLNPWFNRHVAGTEPLDYQPAMHYFGLELVTEAEPEATDNPHLDPPKSSLGAKVEPADGRLMVLEVPTDGAAFKAGINVEDEILAFDGVRILPQDWSDLFARLRIDQAVEVLVSRRGRIIKLDVVLEAEPAEEWQLKDTGATSEIYRQRLSDWLGGWYREGGI